MRIPVVVQHRHVHLSSQDARALFGNEELMSAREIDQRGQFVAATRVEVHGPNGSFPDVCVIGPVRERTQVELSASEAFCLGIRAPVRASSDLDRSATVVLKGAQGEVTAKAVAIVPIRHLHLPPQTAQELGVSHHDIVSLRSVGNEGITFDHVLVRVHPTFRPAFHLTKDEAAPVWLQTGDAVTL
jgi:putative phosphotransacetylase